MRRICVSSPMPEPDAPKPSEGVKDATPPGPIPAAAAQVGPDDAPRDAEQSRDSKKKRGGRGKKSDARDDTKRKTRQMVRATGGLEVEVKLRCESLNCLTEAGLDIAEMEPRH